MQRGLYLLVVGLALAVPLDADYKIQVSTQAILSPKPVPAHAARPKHHHKHPFRQARKNVERAIRKTSPNPMVQAPATQSMPIHPPEVPKMEMPPPQASWSERFFSGVAKVMTHSWKGNMFVWLPAISTDPNTGPTGGLMPVLVIADPATHHIRELWAPSVTYNSFFGTTGTIRYYRYPTDASQIYAVGSYSQHTNRELKARYANSALDDGLLYLFLEGTREVDASPRFYGIGPATKSVDETAYTADRSIGRAAIGVNFAHSWRASFGMRLQRLETETSIIPDTKDVAETFPTVSGVGTNNTVTNEFRLLWDSRDSPITPARGSSGELFFEKTSLVLGSDADYIRYGLEGKRFLLWDNPKQVTVLHGLYEWANGPNIPFYELPSLGGRTSLRGFGEDRFVDRGRILFNVEQRMTLTSLALMGVQTNVEFAPFFDLGTVFPTLPQIQSKFLQPVGGAAFRVAVKPNVVGDVEIGYGKEGSAVFVDLNYPF